MRVLTARAALLGTAAAAVFFATSANAQPNAGPTQPFPAEAKKLQADVVTTLQNLREKFPNLKIAYLGQIVTDWIGAQGSVVKLAAQIRGMDLLGDLCLVQGKVRGVSRQDLVNHLAMYVGETPVDAVVPESQFFVVDAEQL